jgi:hypothetical protein
MTRIHEENPMTHEEAVVQRYPHANSTRVGAILHGDGSVLSPDHWIIIDQGQEIGKGLTEDEAWEDAAKNLDSLMAA